MKKKNTPIQVKSGTKDAGGAEFRAIQKIVSVYSRTTGTEVLVYDRSLTVLPIGGDSIESKICIHCPVALSHNEREPCRKMHENAIRESSRSDGICIYTCELGLFFWTSPLFNEGRYNGSLRGSGFFKHDAWPEKLSVYGDFYKRLLKVKHGYIEKIKSLAEMLLLCAIFLSSGSKDYHELLRRRDEQQTAINSRLAVLKAAHRSGETPEYPIKQEQQLLAALSLGDMESAVSCLNDLLAALLFLNQDNFKYLQLRALELTTLLSRTDKNSGLGENNIPSANCPFVKLIKKAATFEELADTLHSLVKHIAGNITPFRGLPHAVAMRKAEKFIQENFTRKILLPEIASVAGFSAPYFSMLFRKEMGENFSVYLNRLRVEKAKHLLLETDFPLNKIADACCFGDQGWFSKLFKSFTGMKPGNYRAQGGAFFPEISEDNVSPEVLIKLK